MRVAVIGGGLAGITAALALAEAGEDVTLLEAKPRLGGATMSFERGHLVVDTGQHVFLRCCTAYRGLLDRLGMTSSAPIQSRFDVTILTPPTTPSTTRLTPPTSPAPPAHPAHHPSTTRLTPPTSPKHHPPHPHPPQAHQAAPPSTAGSPAPSPGAGRLSPDLLVRTTPGLARQSSPCAEWIPPPKPPTRSASETG